MKQEGSENVNEKRKKIKTHDSSNNITHRLTHK